MPSSKVRQCPYPECIGKSQGGATLAQVVFLFMAYVMLFSRKSSFTPTAVIIYAAPPAIDLAFKKFDAKPFKILKWIFVGYVVSVVVFSFLVIEGSFIDVGTYYTINQDTLLMDGFKVSKDVIAASLALVIGIPAFLWFSRPEKNDKTTLKKIKKGETI